MVALASNRISHGHHPWRTCPRMRRHFAVVQIKTIGFVSVTFGSIERECPPFGYLGSIVALLQAGFRPFTGLRPSGRASGTDERPGCREMDRDTDGEKYAARWSKQVSCTKVSAEGGHGKSGLSRRSCPGPHHHFVTTLREQHLKTCFLAYPPQRISKDKHSVRDPADL